MASDTLVLLPMPRTLKRTSGNYPLTNRRLIQLEAPTPGALYFSAARFQRCLGGQCDLDWSIAAGSAFPPEQVGLALHIVAGLDLPAQGYELTISPNKIDVTAGDEAGIFYGVCTLLQILEVSGISLPCLSIQDWPDFSARGVMLDISRDKVPTMETLFSLVDTLAGWKINQLQLYTEHTFAYQKHPEVWSRASPITGQEILELDAYCKARFIELVPNQNSFGHLHRWLTHPRYTHLAEVQGRFMAPWGPMEGPFSLCPIDPASIHLVHELYDELLPHFSSRMVNVGCDETFDLGHGRSKDECQTRGIGRVYLDFLMKLYLNLQVRGKTMQFWGDIILHHPDLIPELPRDVIALEWGYEASHPFEQHTAQFASSGLPFYVCPGTSAWNTIAGRSDNALANLRNAAMNGIQFGAQGYLTTDWGDNGHWQTLPVSYLGFAAGAAYAWALEANQSLDLPRALDLYAFRDRAGVMGRIAFELGNTYQATNMILENSTSLFIILLSTLEQAQAHPMIAQATFDQALEAIDRALQPIDQAKMDRPDAGLVLREFDLAGRMLRHACHRGLLAAGKITPEQIDSKRSRLYHDLQDIIVDYTDIWLKRNRPGGLAESTARLENSKIDYARQP